MTLDLNKVAGQIDDMGRVLAERAAHQRRALPAARELLDILAEQQEELARVAASDAGRRLRCAAPSSERLNARLPVPAMPAPATLIAADGSQIYPDRHGLAFYYAINVGTIVFRHGTGQAPEVASEPRVYYTEDKVYPGGDAVGSDQVSVERGLAEVRALADRVEAEACGGLPCLGLSDGPLLMWLPPAGSRGRREEILAAYLANLDRLRLAGAPVTGFVSRPHSAEVVALLYLAQLEPEARADAPSLAETSFRGLTDRALFGFLAPGERSALFVRGAADNQVFQSQGHTIYFFYLNTGSDLARVEVPEWVALRPERLDLAHAAIYDQCCFNNGYPYVLTRADELAVIQGDERKVLEQMIMQAMLDQGLSLPELSTKASQKQVARWRRGR